MALLPVTAKLSRAEVTLLGAVAELEGRSRSEVIRAVVAAEVRDRLAGFVKRPEGYPLTAMAGDRPPAA